MSFPPAVADFKAQFTREFRYGTGAEFVLDNDIQRALNEASITFNPNIWAGNTEQQIAYLYVAAHRLVLNIQGAGGLSATNYGRSVNSHGGGTIQSKGVGQANVTYAVPDFVLKSPILSQFMRTDFGQSYIQMLTPRLVGNATVIAGTVSPGTGLAGKPLPLSIVTTSLPSGPHGSSYNQALMATGGISPLTWSVISGSLPTGLSLNANSGLISGTPTTAGTSYFEVKVTDGLGVQATMNYQLVIT